MRALDTGSPDELLDELLLLLPPHALNPTASAPTSVIVTAPRTDLIRPPL
jgi:hypothetical protein